MDGHVPKCRAYVVRMLHKPPQCSPQNQEPSAIPSKSNILEPTAWKELWIS